MIARSLVVALGALPIAAVLAAIPQDPPADELARELPRVAATEPGDALETFRLHEGFRLRAVAVEPAVMDPVSAAFDADGRLFVVEMRGYPYPDDVAPGRVRILEDADRDGHLERSTIFLDDLSWPTSVVPFDGGAFVAAPPEILFAKDTDGDGKADIRKVMFTGFGTQNVQALVNGLLWGPDGWVYGASGGNGGEIRNPSHPDRPGVSVRGRDFRFRPDGSAFETISGGGQFGHAFDDWGHRFVCNNSNHIRQVVLPADAMDRNPAYLPPSPVLDIPVEGAAAPVYRISPAEPWRIVRTRQRAADPSFVKRAPPTELVATGFFTSATGVTIYRGSSYPPEYRGNAFIGDVGGNLVHRKVLEENGTVYRARRADADVEFLASTDNWFRPVNFANTPQGTLLILDMVRETIEHPASIPDPIKRHLDLTSGHDRGRLYELIADGSKRRASPRLSRLSSIALVPYLADPDAWWRETAQRLLIERQAIDESSSIRALLKDRPTALGRVHALWTLDALGTLGSGDVVLAARDDEPRVREQAAKLATRFLKGSGDDRVLKTLLTLARDDDPMVRFAAAIALGNAEDLRVIPALADLARRSGDDPWTRAALLSGLTPGRALAFWKVLEGLQPDALATGTGRAWFGEVCQILGAQQEAPGIRAILDRVAGAEADPAVARVALLGLGRGLRRAGGSLQAYGIAGDGERWDVLVRKTSEVAGDPGAVPAAREEAIALLGLAPTSRAVAALEPLLDARQPSPVQVAALRALGERAEPEIGELVVGRWKALGPNARREAAEVLFARKDRLSSLLRAIQDRAIAASDLDPARRKQLLEHPDAALRDRALALLGQDASTDRGKVVAAYRPALDLPSSIERGRAVFGKQCATCHKAQGQGMEVGPDMATVAGRSAEDLLVHILDPNREVAPNSVNYTVATEDGAVLSGLIVEETNTAVTLLRAEGIRDVVPRSRIEGIASTGLSLMPEGLEREIGPQDLADLIAFLRGQEHRP